MFSGCYLIYKQMDDVLINGKSMQETTQWYFFNFPALYTHRLVNVTKYFLTPNDFFKLCEYFIFWDLFISMSTVQRHFAFSLQPQCLRWYRLQMLDMLSTTKYSRIKTLSLNLSLTTISLQIYLYPGRYWMLRTQKQSEREREMRLLPPNSVLYLSFR